MKMTITLLTLLATLTSFASSEVSQTISNDLAEALKKTSTEDVGEVLSASCTKVENKLTCEFTYDLPEDYCWYGQYKATANYTVVSGYIILTSSSIEWTGEVTDTTDVKQDYQAIYNALSVTAVNQNPSYGSMDFLKSVGGLECTNEYYGESSLYNCELDQNNNAEEIYNALTVEEVNLTPGMAGSFRLTKSIGGLKCVKQRVVYPGATPTYTCTL